MGSARISDDLNFRRMSADMLDSVMYVENRAFEFGWKRSTFQNCIDHNHDCWVIENGSHTPIITVAHAVLCVTVDDAELLNLSVDPTWQRRGLGRMMLEHILARARILGAARISLEVRRSNFAAMSLYSSVGFKQVGTRKDYYRTRRAREDAYIMQLQILTRGHTTSYETN